MEFSAFSVIFQVICYSYSPIWLLLSTSGLVGVDLSSITIGAAVLARVVSRRSLLNMYLFRGVVLRKENLVS